MTAQKLKASILQRAVQRRIVAKLGEALPLAGSLQPPSFSPRGATLS